MKILKFGAIWCKECLVMRSIWDEIEYEIPELVFEYYDADEHSDILKSYNVADIPTVIFLDSEDNEVLRLDGAVNKEELLRMIRENIERVISK